jgi:hypothetical protein
MTRSIRTALCTLALALAWTTPALAEEPTYEFDFPGETTTLPESVSPDEVVTIATERKGTQRKGVILLANGRAIYFRSVDSAPLRAPDAAPDAFTSLGK